MEIDLLEHWENLQGIAGAADGAIQAIAEEIVEFGSITTLCGPFSQVLRAAAGDRLAVPTKRCLLFDDVSVRDTSLLRGYRGSHVAEFGMVATIVQPGMSVFGHWLIDILIRLSYLELLETSEPIHVLVPNTPLVAPVARRFLGILAELDPRIVVEFIDPTLVVRARRCLVLPVPRAGNAYPLQCLRQFDRVTEAARRANRKVIPTAANVFVSRAKWGDNRRRLANRDEVEKLASDRGMIILTPEAHDVASVIVALNEATLVMGERGSGVHFTAFSQSARAAVTLISAQRSFTGMEFAQSGLCRVRGQRSIFVAGEALGAASETAARAPAPVGGEVFEISLELLNDALDGALGR